MTEVSYERIVTVAMSIEFRILTEMAELEQVCDLEYEIWGRDKAAATPAVVMKVTNAHGGVTVGAYDGDRMVGMAWAFAVPRPEGENALWSHVAGVLREYRSQGVGFGLKKAQREWGLANGYKTMHWTFDPMQSKNANFNFRILGAVVRKYKPNFYGQMQDSINPGLPSDRFEATWVFGSERVTAAMESKSLPPIVDQFSNETFLVGRRDGAFVTCQPSAFDLPFYAVEIPLDYAGLMEISPDTGKHWQAHMREAMLKALAAGYSVVDHVREGSRCWHVLVRPEQE